ncbi:MAG TPA: hypothetical protein VG432_10600 [Gemmatimonadaceae bacterium]|nr:hypothetical protein [Gemmatimonadaceae bacterium]
MRTLRSLAAPAAVALLVACGPGGSTAPRTPAPADTAKVPLNDLGAATYLGFQGGLYPQGSNAIPAAHLDAGLAAAASVQPLDSSGAPSSSGRYVLLSIGMSNTTQEFCSAAGTLGSCDSWSFMGQAAADPAVNHATLAIVNGARGGQAAPSWVSPSSAEYDRIRDNQLAPQGLSEKQVQVVWLKVANAQPKVSLPRSDADAYILETQIGQIARALRARYANLRQVFITSRIWAGYATTTLNPEPYAYEEGFSAKWAIEAQLRQASSGTIDARAGDLRYGANGVAPWLAWGPYPWAAGMTPRSDGLTWAPGDFVSDGTHPSRSGREKVATMLLDFFSSSPVTRCWFLAGGSCG